MIKMRNLNCFLRRNIMNWGIKKLLKCVPDIPIPNGLKNNLQADVNLNSIKKEPSVIHRWFFRSDESFSFSRAACAAMIDLVFLIPFSYGATKIVKFVVEELTVIYEGDESERTTIAFSFNPSVTGDCISNDEDAENAEKEMLRLIQQGKAEEISPGEYKATTSLGCEVIYDTLGIPLEILASEERQEKIKELTDEILELRRTGNFTKTFLEEVVSVGKKKLRVRIYNESYVLSNNKTINITSGYEVKE